MTNEQPAAVLNGIVNRLQRAVDGVEAELVDNGVLTECATDPSGKVVIVAPVLDALREEISGINDMALQVRPRG